MDLCSHPTSLDSVHTKAGESVTDISSDPLSCLLHMYDVPIGFHSRVIRGGFVPERTERSVVVLFAPLLKNRRDKSDSGRSRHALHCTLSVCQ